MPLLSKGKNVFPTLNLIEPTKFVKVSVGSLGNLFSQVEDNGWNEWSLIYTGKRNHFGLVLHLALDRESLHQSALAAVTWQRELTEQSVSVRRCKEFNLEVCEGKPTSSIVK